MFGEGGPHPGEKEATVFPQHLIHAAATLLGAYRATADEEEGPYPAFTNRSLDDPRGIGLYGVIANMMREGKPFPAPDKPNTLVWVLPIECEQAEDGQWVVPLVGRFWGLEIRELTEMGAYRAATLAVGEHIDGMLVNASRRLPTPFSGGVVPIPAIVIVRTLASVGPLIQESAEQISEWRRMRRHP